jgi:hypothetical protein
MHASSSECVSLLLYTNTSTYTHTHTHKEVYSYPVKICIHLPLQFLCILYCMIALRKHFTECTKNKTKLILNYSKNKCYYVTCRICNTLHFCRHDTLLTVISCISYVYLQWKKCIIIYRCS